MLPSHKRLVRQPPEAKREECVFARQGQTPHIQCQWCQVTLRAFYLYEIGTRALALDGGILLGSFAMWRIPASRDATPMITFSFELAGNFQQNPLPPGYTNLPPSLRDPPQCRGP